MARVHFVKAARKDNPVAKAEELKGLISNPAVKIEPKEPPSGR